MGKLTHFDKSGKAAMVDITKKKVTERFAVATGRIDMKPSTIRMIRENEITKGDVVAVARIAGIMAAKRVDELIPLCHKLMLSEVALDIEAAKEGSSLHITCSVRSAGKTGVEMEALTGVTVAALTVYDMCKAVDREMVLSEIKLMEKKGGRSGHYKRKTEKRRIGESGKRPH